MSALIDRSSAPRQCIAIEAIDPSRLTAACRRLDTAQRRWLDVNGFDAKPGTVALLPDANGRLVRVLAGVDGAAPLAALAGLPTTLPPGVYQLDPDSLSLDPVQAALGWALGAYAFTRYRKADREPATLAVEPAVLAAVQPLAEATTLVRDLVNTPTEDMGPEQLGDAIKALGKTHRAKVRDWVGDELLKANFPTIHAVGRASHREPRLVELSWGKAGHPKLVLVGKGVCFDTGGLDLKPADGMRWMKKDMGGAAHAIALAGLVMQAKLPVRLTLLVPAVENAVAGNAFRPGEVIVTRAGHSVEIDNTDAEGRLILCDALAYGAEQTPDLMIDFARRTVKVEEREVRVTPTEFKLLQTLASSPGAVFSCQSLVQQIHNYQCSEQEAAELMKVTVRRLRQKLEPDPDQPRYIVNVRGFGYALAEPSGLAETSEAEGSSVRVG